MPVPHWELLGAIEGAMDLCFLGWSTAFTFEVLSQLYRREGETVRDK